MSRRSLNPSRRVADGGLPTVGGLFHPKSRSPPVLTIALVVLGVILLVAYFNSGSGVTVTSRESVTRSEGNPGQQKAKVSELPKFGRPAKLRSSSWWTRYFVQTGLTENEGPLKKFEDATSKNKYKPGCQIFHLSSPR
ncbi:hypothetical protein ZEAMMB73_Zm00001d039881 [Zea mays]|uniref:Uncharacterized protein n=1 Tax=Zea mays TaxID=4577 RepID=A0A1D6MLJ9_MAIZE|nr:hypothetical protein ZEAMMB73_Zm00001d039881 [Zea mays]